MKLNKEINDFLNIVSIYKDTGIFGKTVRQIINNEKVEYYNIAIFAENFTFLKETNLSSFIIEEKNNFMLINYKKNELRLFLFDEKYFDEILKKNKLTVDSIYYDFKKKTLGNQNGGVIDCKDKFLTSKTDMSNVFKHNPEYILEIIYLEGKYNYDTDAKIIKNIENNTAAINGLTVNKKRDFLNKILTIDDPSRILRKFRNVFGIIIPELKECFDFDQNTRYHGHDVYEHTIRVIKHSNNVLTVRIAALLHDIGKPSTYIEIFDKEYGMEGKVPNHPLISYEMANIILNRLEYCPNIINEILFFIKYHDLGMAELKGNNSEFIKKIKEFQLDTNILNNFFSLKCADADDHIWQNLDETKKYTPEEYKKVKKMTIENFNK